MKNYVLTVTLNPAIDKTVKINDFTLGLEHRCRDVYLSAGGKGVNVSQALIKFGVNSVATGFLGGTSGDYIEDKLSKENIRADFIHVENDTRTSITIIDSKNKRTTRLLEPGLLVKKKDIVSFKKKYLKLLRKCSYVVLSGRNIPGAPDSIYKELIKTARRNSRHAILDTSGKPLLLGMTAKPFLVKPNLKEAEYILGKELNTISKVKKAVRVIIERGIENVIISMGSEGVIASDGKDIIIAKPQKGQTINPVGSGDALIGGFLYSKIKGKNFEESITLAVAAGTANSLSINPGHFMREEVFRTAKKIKVTKIKF